MMSFRIPGQQIDHPEGAHSSSRRGRCNQILVWLVALFGVALYPSQLSARLIPVRHKEGTSHGFVVLRSQEGQELATGEIIQTIEGERVTSELVLHFGDGSIYDDVTLFSQGRDFRLISDHLRQQGRSFPKPLDVRIDVASGDVEVSSDEDGKHKTEQHHLRIPEDVANGMLLTLVKNISPSEPETTVSMLATSAKPRVVKLRIHAEGKQSFSASGEHLEGTHYVIHTDIGGAAGAVANVIGKQRPDIHFWIVPGKAPAFMKFTGQLYVGGPIWNIALATVRWETSGSTKKKE
jgi:hypothetical protein